jgi:hypothetical protein
MKKMLFCLLITTVCFFSFSILAEEETNDNDSDSKLIDAKTLKFFPLKSCTAEWEKGSPKLLVDNDVTDKEFPPLIFDSIDIKKRTARLIGNQGAGDATVIANLTGITFIERTRVGNFNFTTVFFSCVEGTEDYIAVHSRHINLLVGTPLSSQMHGICKIWE